MSGPASTQEVWAELLIDALVASGVREVVLSPGSRSTPLVLALASRPDVALVEVIDERAAGFVALGIGRASGRPAALVCTSGSAPTHYFPALVEADAAGIPLVVVSTNRPFALQRGGESQTIDQTKLFGDRVRSFVDLGEPSAKAMDLRAMRRLVAQSVFATRYPLPGPAHLDVRFVKPLEPVTNPSEADVAHRAFATSLRSEGVPRFFEAEVRASADAIHALATRIACAERPIVVVGPRHAFAAPLTEALLAFARRTSIPVFVDPTSNARFGEGADAFFGCLDALYRSPTARESLAPDFVLQVGRSPVATGFAKLLADTDVELALVDEHAFLDPHSRARLVVRGAADDVLARVGSRLDAYHSRPKWFEPLRRIELGVRARLETLSRATDGALAEPDVVRTLLGQLPKDTRLGLGNSLSVRGVDSWVPPDSRAVFVDSQRGASGIDGLVAGFVGGALATRQPGALLLGDVSLAHDLGSLALLRRLETSAVVVVVDNGGGRIFEQLPIATTRPEAMPHFTTPTGIDFGAVATALGVSAARVTTAADLRRELSLAFASPHATLIHCIVSPHDMTTRNSALFHEVERIVAAEASA